MKKLSRYAVALILGLSLMVFGIIDISVKKYAPAPMSDAEIIERARDLGMVDMKDKWIEDMESSKRKD